jgi:hypothetical protein
MSAVPVFIPPAFVPPPLVRSALVRSALVPPALVPDAHPVGRPKETSFPVTRPVTTPAHWQLTERGIAVVLLLAALILTVAVIVIGVTAVRVTGADYDAGSDRSGQARS